MKMAIGHLHPSDHVALSDHTGCMPLKAPGRQFKFLFCHLLALWKTLFQ